MTLPESSTDLFRLDGRTALVTGASKGLGEVMANALSGAGAQVAVTSRHLEELQATAEAIEAHTGNPVFAVEADASDRSQVDASVAAVCDRFGAIDILVNNAGINIRAPILELSDEEWKTVLDINLSGPFYYCRAAGAVMVERGFGRVINLGSNPFHHFDSGTYPVRIQQGWNRAIDPHLALEMGAFRGHRQRHLPGTVFDSDKRDSARGSRSRPPDEVEGSDGTLGRPRRTGDRGAVLPPLPLPASRPARPCWSTADTSAGNRTHMRAAELIAKNLASPQGLAFDADDQLFVAESGAGRVTRVSDGGRLIPYAETGGRPMGIAFDDSGDLFVAESGRHHLLLVSPDEAVEVYASQCHGRRFFGPRDLCFTHEGGVLFCDTGSAPDRGSLFQCDLSGEVDQLADELASPVGWCFSTIP